MNACLIIGCNGRKLYGITMCEGTKNLLIDLRLVPSSDTEFYDYLTHMKLVNGNVVTDLNKISNIIRYIYEYRLIPQHAFESFHDYIAMHRKCGMYLFIQPIPNGD